uniref:Uncharacterized protein n=1 Tax=Siphoviridae sp. ct43U4 TaxID=2826285 RepID=A0A8S5MZN3_9CAUD|nr:MAG TPA: hypothetical protein [Siphoviridae sp. ct43U4]
MSTTAKHGCFIVVMYCLHLTYGHDEFRFSAYVRFWG